MLAAEVLESRFALRSERSARVVFGRHCAPASNLGVVGALLLTSGPRLAWEAVLGAKDQAAHLLEDAATVEGFPAQRLAELLTDENARFRTALIARLGEVRRSTSTVGA